MKREVSWNTGGCNIPAIEGEEGKVDLAQEFETSLGSTDPMKKEEDKEKRRKEGRRGGEKEGEEGDEEEEEEEGAEAATEMNYFKVGYWWVK